MTSFADLAASRRAWIDQVLQPWCRQAARKDLRLAELEWTDIAGKVDPDTTLWAWAWSRFPDLVQPELSRIDETHAVSLTLRDGRQFTGFPDARQSQQGQLVLLTRAGADARLTEAGPFSIDDIASVQRV